MSKKKTLKLNQIKEFLFSKGFIVIKKKKIARPCALGVLDLVSTAGGRKAQFFGG